MYPGPHFQTPPYFDELELKSVLIGTLIQISMTSKLFSQFKFLISRTDHSSRTSDLQTYILEGSIKRWNRERWVNFARISSQKRKATLEEASKYEEWLKSLVQPKEETEGRQHGGLQLPQEGSGRTDADLLSLVTATEPNKMARSCDKGGSS